MTPKEIKAKILARIEVLKTEIQNYWEEIRVIESQCNHQWTGARHKLTNYFGNSYGGSFDQRYWERECIICGKIDIVYKEGYQIVAVFKD